MSDGFITFLIFASAGVLFVLAVIGGLNEQTQWEAYRVEHHCVVAGDSTGSMGFGYMAGGGRNGGGFVSTYTPGKTLWHCDNGMEHWR